MVMVRNELFTIRRGDISEPQCLADQLEARIGDDALRWYISHANSDTLTIEAALCEGASGNHSAPSSRAFYAGKSAVINIVPTGVGCELGGYAGDASPITNLLAGCVDYVITNPNALNASDFVGALDSVLYTEGYCIDKLAKGMADLWVPTKNRIGMIVEKAEPWALDVVFNVINTARAVYGVDIVDYVITDEPIGSRSVRNPSGAYVGVIDNPGTLLRACDSLIEAGATALAVTTNIQGLPSEEYVQHFLGNHPNPMGGVEALISHLIVDQYGVPAAHAPMINLKGAEQCDAGRAVSASVKKLALARDVVDARGAGEMTSASGLACVLMGLQRAPQIFENPRCRFVDTINLKNVLAVIAPASTMGGIPVLYAQKLGIPVIAVRSNQTVLNVTANHLRLNGIIEVENYTEAAGVVTAIRQGISLESLYRPLRTMDYQRVASVVPQRTAEG